MSTDTEKYSAEDEIEARHSAFEEFNRDERRPALLLLSALAIAALFFALGIMVGRWTIESNAGSQSNSPAKDTTKPAPAQSNSQPAQQPANSPSAITPAQTPAPRDSQARFSVLVATFNAPEDAQPLIKKLEQAGYKDVRTNTPSANASQPKFSVLVGHYTRDEARDAVSRMRITGDAKLKNARVIETPAN